MKVNGGRWILMAAKTRYSVQTEKWLARNENEPFWQWFGKPIQFQVSLNPNACKNQIFGPDRKMARAQWKWAVLAMVWEAQINSDQTRSGLIENPRPTHLRGKCKFTHPMLCYVEVYNRYAMLCSMLCLWLTWLNLGWDADFFLSNIERYVEHYADIFLINSNQLKSTHTSPDQPKLS